MTRPKYLNLAGVPLGGIGCGKIDICPDGAFRHLTIHNNLDLPITDIHNPSKPMPSFPVVDLDACPELTPGGLEGCFLGAFVEHAGAVVLKEHEPGLTATLPRDAIRFTGEVPSAELVYPAMDGVELTLSAFSSLVLGEPESDGLRASSLPGFRLTLTAVNRSPRARRVAVLMSFANLIGMGGFPNAGLRDLRGNGIEYHDDGGLRHLAFSASVPKVDVRLDGSYTLAVDAAPEVDVSHATWDIDASHRAKRTFWDGFARDGRIAGSGWGGLRAGAWCAGQMLAPGATLRAHFVLSWCFPTRSDARGKGLRHRNAYARHYPTSLVAAQTLVREGEALRARTDAWRQRLHGSNLPGWLATKLINDAFPLLSNSMHADDGRFASSEAPLVMNGCMGTMDQRAASHPLYAMGFPALSRGELSLFAAQQIGEDHPQRHATHWDTATLAFDRPLDRAGAILHDVGWDDLDGGTIGGKGWLSAHWPDLTLVFALQCCGHATWTGDRAFLDAIYPRVRAALRFNRRLDQDGDGIAELWGPGCCTFDSEAFHYFGASAYIATLTLAAARAGARMARWQGDEAFAAEMDAWFARVRPVVERTLFCPELGWFRSWVDERHALSAGGERPHARESRNSMVAQLAGVWFAQLLDLGEILDPAQVRSALAALVAKNLGLPAYCPAQEVTADDATVSFSWPYYAESYVIAPLLATGRGDEARAALRKIHAAITELDGSPWSSPLVWRGAGNGEREWGSWYMTNTASWAVLPALCGFAWNAIDGAMVLDPRIPRSLGRLQRIPLFMPGYHAVVDADDQGATLTITACIGGGSVRVASLAAGCPATLSRNGAQVATTWSTESSGRVRSAVDLTLRDGDRLELRYQPT